MSDSPSFGAALFNARSNSRLGQALRREGVKRSAEFLRIAGLPRRSTIGSIDVEALSAVLRLPDDDPNRCKGCKFCDRGRMSLFPDQAYALKEMYDVGGAFIGTNVGSGKSLMIILGALVTGAKRPLAIMPAGARPGFENDMIPLMRKHWRMPANLMIGSYEELSSTNNKDFLSARMPDWVFADEGHALKDEDASRTRRFIRYYDEFPDTHLAVFTGSPIDRTIRAMAHLLAIALRGYCPVPYLRQDGRNVHREELATWQLAIDANVPEEDRFGAGALLEFESWIAPDVRARIKTDLELAQACWGARLISVPGVVFSSTETTKTTIHIRELPVSVPPAVVDAFELLREANQTPAGESYGDAVELYRLVRQLGQGFFYRWVWPKDPITGKEVPDLVWIQARQNWHRKVRNVIAHSRGTYDSKAEVQRACERFESYQLAKTYGQKDVLEKLRDLPRIDSQEWRNWQTVEKNYTPVTETIWIDRFLVNRVAEWLDERPGIAWVESKAMGRAIRECGFRYYSGGENEIRYETVSCAASIKAHSFAKNLQQFDRNLVVTPPTKGTHWEQLIGRTDRTGQTSARIEVDLFLHVREFWTSFYKARQDASFSQAPGALQKLMRAETRLIMTEADFVMKTYAGTDPLWKFTRRKEAA